MANNYRNIYIKNWQHKDYDENRIENDNVIDVIISKIQLLIYTNKGDVLSDPDFGCDVEKLLWETNVDEQIIKQYIDEQVYNYVPEAIRYNYRLDFYIIPGTQQDIGILEISLDFINIRAVYK